MQGKDNPLLIVFLHVTSNKHLAWNPYIRKKNTYQKEKSILCISFTAHEEVRKTRNLLKLLKKEILEQKQEKLVQVVVDQIEYEGSEREFKNFKVYYAKVGWPN